MPSIFSHGMVVIAAGLGVGQSVVNRRLLALSVFCAILPDCDVLAFQFGIPYESQWGHRGFTHSLFFSGMVAALAVFCCRFLQRSGLITFLVVFVATASHAILDALTTGGLGVALWWPLSDERYLFPWRPIKASLLDIGRFFGRSGLSAIRSELVWVWLPALALGFVLAFARHAFKAFIRTPAGCAKANR